MRGNDGNFYGTTQTGGQSGFGTVFKLTRSGTPTNFASFLGETDGASPSGLLQGAEGNFYGIAGNVFFKITPAGVRTNLATLPGNPNGELLQGSDGSFYGTNSSGGTSTSGAGTVFKITPQGALTTLVNFNGANGFAPRSGLTLGNDGNFYGSTFLSGLDASAGGTVFRMTPAGVLTTLHTFSAAGPHHRLLLGSDGNLYGTTFSQPQVFKITTSGVFTKLATLTGAGGGLIEGNDGNFYGIIKSGGTGQKGAVFRVTPQGVLTALLNFSGNNGAFPNGSLVQGSDGYLYGVTGEGGAGGYGNVFRLALSGEANTVINFAGGEGANAKPDGRASPALIEGSDGAFYGTSTGDLPNFGTAFRVTSTGLYSVVGRFTSTLGWSPNGLLKGNDGNFYGCGENANTIFKLTPAGVLSQFATLSGATGNFPQANFILSSDGNFYGTAREGGSGGLGAVYRVTPAGAVSAVASFNNTTGGYPVGVLLEASDGNFYCTVQSGVVQITKAGAVAKLVNFGGRTSSGLAEFNGALYGTTFDGGTSNLGTIFKTTFAGALTTLVNFTGTNGATPYAGLTLGPDGDFYGTTYAGGSAGTGTIFKMTPAGTLTMLVDSAGDPTLIHPQAPFMLSSDGNLYGTTAASIIRFTFPGEPIVGVEPAENITTTGATLLGKVNARGSSTAIVFEYGTDGVNFPNTVKGSPAILNGLTTTIVGATLTGLQQGVTHFYRIKGTNSVGAQTSSVQSFTTLKLPTAVPTAVSNLSNSGATLNGVANGFGIPTTVSIEYGTSNDNFPIRLTATPSTVTGFVNTTVIATVASLLPGTTYYYRIVASNGVGTVASSPASFTTLTNPIAFTGTANALSTTRAQVNGTVDPKGSNAEITFEFGTDGINFPNSFSAAPGSVTGSDPVAVTATLTGLTQGTTYYYRIRAVGPGGTGLSATSTFSLSILSGLVQAFPDPPPPSGGTVTVNFSPSNVGAWRFKGDTKWINSGIPAGNLAAGQRSIEFIPIPGFVRPPSETVDVTSSAAITLDRIYYQTPTSGSGSLTVQLKPDAIAAASVPVASRVQWRIVGETPWRNSGTGLNGLAAGSYLVECKGVAGRETPATVSVSIGNNDSQDITLTYFAANTSVGASPLPQTFSNVSTNEDLPFAYLGQIRTEVGSGTGFVVKRRVVATAGHVVFDDGTLSAITDIQWFFQRHTGTHEPRPQVPRGYYLAAGYAAQRTLDNSPGEGSAQSQTLDYAALYFVEEAGRGGYGGYLASDSGDDNEFLKSTDQKILAGYPVDGILAADIGKLHATAPFTPALSPAFGETWTTTQVRGLGGISGGPLFIRNNGGAYLPAAIYLGGAGQTVVRAIDSSVVDLFFRAEVSGNGGDNNTGGGITHTSVAGNLNVSAPGSLRVIIEPAGVGSSGGSWKLNPETTLRPGGSQKSGLSPGTYSLSFAPVSGFQTPPAQSVSISGGQLTTVTFTYQPSSGESPLETWRQLNFGPGATNTGDAADTNDFDKDGVKNIDEFTAGTDPKNASDSLKISTATKAGATFTVGCAGKAGRIYTLQRNTALTGMWTDLSSQGPLASDGPVSLSDTAAPAGKAFYRIEVSTP